MPVEWPSDAVGMDEAGARDSGRDHRLGFEPDSHGCANPQPGHAALGLDAAVPPLTAPSHPQHELYAMNYHLLGAAAFAQDDARQRAAASLTAMETRAEMPRVDHIVHNGRGDIIAICGALTDPAHKRVAGKLENLCAVAVETSSLEAFRSPASKSVPVSLDAGRDLRTEIPSAERQPAPIEPDRQNEHEGRAKPRSM